MNSPLRLLGYMIQLGLGIKAVDWPGHQVGSLAFIQASLAAKPGNEQRR